MQYNTQEGRIDVEPSVVANEAQFLEFVHEEIDASARGTNNFRQDLLRYPGNHF